MGATSNDSPKRQNRFATLCDSICDSMALRNETPSRHGEHAFNPIESRRCENSVWRLETVRSG